MMKDPYKYFRIEARELLEGLCQGALELEKGKGGAETVSRLLRLAHTLKGASRVVKQVPLAEIAHAMEDRLAPFRGGTVPVDPASAGALLRQIDAAEGKLRELEPPPQPLSAPAAVPGTVAEQARDTPRPGANAAVDGQFSTVRVDLAEMDALFESITEVGSAISSLRGGFEPLDQARTLVQALADDLEGARPSRIDRRALAADLLHELKRARRRLSGTLEQAEARMGHVQADAQRLRLVPVSGVFASLERAVRDAAALAQRPATFQSTGGDHRIDASILGGLRDALLHVVRNAVAHGIEPAAGRAAAGKPAEGRVHLSVERRGSRIAFTCSDDGRGIDVEGIRAVALRQGLVSPAQAEGIGLQEAIGMLLRGGVTTSRSADALSGRGVGLDVLRDTVGRLQGELALWSEPGQGTRVEIVVPITLSSAAVMTVEAAGMKVSVPLESVVEIVLLRPPDLDRSGGREMIRYRERMIPLVSLAELLGAGPSAATRPSFSAAILKTPGGDVAIRVDRILELTRAVIRPIPAVVQADSAFFGASLDAEGCPRLALDPAGVLEAARRATAATPSLPAVRHRPILVIDDSLTTRMLEQSILESAGYQVDLAVSGEEGLAKARERQYGLFICDVEMPGMNGFEFVACARADSALKDVPSILVTSLLSPEDKSRGKKAGARAYIVKSEFDQGSFLQIIRGLVD